MSEKKSFYFNVTVEVLANSAEEAEKHMKMLLIPIDDDSKTDEIFISEPIPSDEFWKVD